LLGLHSSEDNYLACLLFRPLGSSGLQKSRLRSIVHRHLPNAEGDLEHFPNAEGGTPLPILVRVLSGLKGLLENKRLLLPTCTLNKANTPGDGLTLPPPTTLPLHFQSLSTARLIMVLGRIPSNVQPAFLAKRRRERVLGKTKHTVTEGARKKSKKPAKVRFRVKSAAAAPVEATANPEVPVASSSQVATEPATPTPSASASASLPPPPQPVTVKLPTTLKHPTMREVTSEAMAAVGVECTGVPTQFLRDKLAIHSPALVLFL